MCGISIRIHAANVGEKVMGGELSCGGRTQVQNIPATCAARSRADPFPVREVRAAHPSQI